MKHLKYLIAAMFLMTPYGLRAGEAMLLSTDPAEPRGNQVFDVIYTLEFCGDTFPGNSPQNRIVEVSGGIVRILAPYALQLCGGQPYIPSYRWSIGPLLAGTYQLELFGYNDDPQTSFPIASGEVTVAPALTVPEPSVVPTTGALSLLSLSFLAALTAVWRLRRR